MQHSIKANNGAYERFMEYFKHVLQHANSYGSKSSILSPWIWLIGTLLASLTMSVYFKAPKEVIVLLSVLISIAMICAIVAYFFCLFKGNTDALRSEKFNIEKLAIEKQSSSDSLIDVHSSPASLPNTVKVIEPVQEDQ